jgi:undecaprenyl pyrophosphate synthase
MPNVKPAFSKKELLKSFKVFEKRQRRFGGL